MGDTFELTNDSGVVTFGGGIADPGATSGDVLTVQDDGTIAAETGGGSSSSGALIPVRVASTGNIDLAAGGIPDNSLTDGVTVSDGDRVLIWQQTDPNVGGIWIVNAAGAWTQATDDEQFVPGALVGAGYDGSVWWSSVFVCVERDGDGFLIGPVAVGSLTPQNEGADVNTTKARGTINATGNGFGGGGVIFPSADPHVAGAWWDDAGTLTKSSG